MKEHTSTFSHASHLQATSGAGDLHEINAESAVRGERARDPGQAAVLAGTQVDGSRLAVAHNSDGPGPGLTVDDKRELIAVSAVTRARESCVGEPDNTGEGGDIAECLTREVGRSTATVSVGRTDAKDIVSLESKRFCVGTDSESSGDGDNDGVELEHGLESVVLARSAYELCSGLRVSLSGLMSTLAIR